jgi:hypothetical protein
MRPLILAPIPMQGTFVTNSQRLREGSKSPVTKNLSR